jgi:integrase
MAVIPLRRTPAAELPTLAGAVDHWLARAALAPRTRHHYAADLAPLLAVRGASSVTALDEAAVAGFLAHQETLAPASHNRRLAALRALVRFCLDQGWISDDPTAGSARRRVPARPPRALDPGPVEAILSRIADPRDRALFTLIYDCGLRASEALAINCEDIGWHERVIRIAGKGGKVREAFFSRPVAKLLDAYLAGRGQPTSGPLFVTARRAKRPRTADLAVEGTARLSYRQADTRWKAYTRAQDPAGQGWDLHQLRHTAITVRAAHGYTEMDLKRFSGHSSSRSLEIYIAPNRESAKRKAREWERTTQSGV